MKEADRKRFDALISWSQQHGAKLHPSLEVYNDDTTKFSLRVKESVTDPPGPGFTAVTCPISTTLSYLNALIDGPLVLPIPSGPYTGAFPDDFLGTVPPHVISRFFLMHEYLKGRESFWHPYIAALPQPEHISAWALPAFWPDDDMEILKGTNAYTAIGEMQSNLKTEYKQARKTLKAGGFPNVQDYTRLLYNWAFCIFTSRSFRPSLIVSPSTNSSISELLPGNRSIDDFSILQPLFDIANHSITAKYSWDVTSGPWSCQLLCRDTYSSGEQVYNNYGMKTNSELLLAYGFILPETKYLHNDYMHLRKRQDESGTDKPTDFLISLRPLSHPSSLVGRARPVPATRLGLTPLIAEFLHFEPALICDLTPAMATPEELEVLGQSPDADAGEQKKLPAELKGLVERIKQGLTTKLAHDYQRLKEVEFEHQPANPNQVLALTYRKQCENVLVAALQSLGN